jgi:hypothetical protein
MAGFFQEFAKDLTKGFFNNDYLRDYTHASKTFVTNAYGYAPKYKFLYHVYFDTNFTQMGSPPGLDPKAHNFGLVVKSAQLPKYTFDTAVLNQYNRKRIVQTKIKYDPIQITFHDDNSNMITNLWNNYYTYYYKDGLQTDIVGPNAGSQGEGGVNFPDINTRTQYNNSIAGYDDWGYIGESKNVSSGIKAPFFRAINIYGFNQHNFTLYRLINPMISSFSHDTYDYKETGGVMEHQMTIEYETVQYYTGAIDGKTPSAIVTGFGDTSNYDTKLSPISQPGGNSSILGQGGLVDGVGGFVDALSSGNILGAVKIAGNLQNTFKNPAGVLNAARTEALGAATSWLVNTPNRNNLFNFPTQSTLNNATTVVNQNLVNTSQIVAQTVANSLKTKFSEYSFTK